MRKYIQCNFLKLFIEPNCSLIATIYCRLRYIDYHILVHFLSPQVLNHCRYQKVLQFSNQIASSIPISFQQDMEVRNNRYNFSRLTEGS